MLKNLRETANILLQGVPGHISLAKVEKDLLGIEEVLGIHDVHIWSLEGETDIFTGHLIVETDHFVTPAKIRNKIKKVLLKHHIEHSTIELEQKGICSGFDCTE
ncbi:hypothetical protein MUO66_08915 [Candidatus Bathyarchaeota archaeon]|nr:hypothetical protein [Candidatus Bathyarchaeota archaeon]